MQKIFFISLLGPVLIIINRSIEIISSSTLLGLDGVYECGLSIPEPCSFWMYVFNSGEAQINYIEMLLSFVVILAVASYIFSLIKLYRNKRFVWLWTLVGITVVVLVTSPFIWEYMQLYL